MKKVKVQEPNRKAELTREKSSRDQSSEAVCIPDTQLPMLRDHVSGLSRYRGRSRELEVVRKAMERT